jgi:MFS family permease
VPCSAQAFCGNVINGLSMIAAAVISDRVGRRKVLLATSAAGVPWGLALFPILDMQSVPLFWLGTAVTFVIAGLGFGIAGAFLSELFHTRYRYTAAGLAYSTAAIAGGAIPPIVAASIIGRFGSLSFGILLAAYCVVSVICTLRVRETCDTDLTVEPQESPAAL